MNEIISAERNPFAREELPSVSITGLVSVEQQRAIAEVQARMIIARSNPRNPIAATDNVLRDCARKTLAEAALYQYSRGGSSVSGPSIRLMETIARRWGNISSGIKELSRADGYSECVAYAWDLETGYYDERQFQVRHWRDTKQGGYRLTDERDIYEIIANMGQRRKRAVLLAVIPGDVVEAAVEQCEETLNTNVDMRPDALQKMVAAFGEFGVTQQHIEKRIQCRLQAVRPAQVVQLRKIYASLKDEMSGPGDWFDLSEQKPTGTAGAWDEIGKRHEQSRQEQQTNTRPPPPSKEELRRQAAEKKAAAEREEAERARLAEQQRQEAEARRKAEERAAAPAEYYLLDDNGELIGDVHNTADSFANAFLDLYSASTNRPALMENNRDTLEEIEHDAPAVDDRIRFAISEIETFTGEIDGETGLPANDQPTTQYYQIPLETGRGGKPDAVNYLKKYKAELATTKADTYLDFIAAQLPIADLPASVRLQVVRVAVAYASGLGIDPPETFRQQAEEPKQEAPAQAETHAESKPAEPDKAEQQCAGWCADMDAIDSHSALVEFVQNKAISSRVNEWQTTRPELYKRMQETSVRNDARLKKGGAG